MRKKRYTIAVLIPCHNEEKSIAACINSCLTQTRTVDQIVVVDDGSTDGSSAVLASFGDQIEVVTIPVATGNKSYAQEIGLQHITTDLFIATDGDTVLDSRFVEFMSENFQDKKVMAVGGYVKSLAHNWLTACRELDYILGQDLYKVAQAYLNAVFVIPGCAGVFRTHIFRKYLSFDHDTLTEDLDFTYRLHKSNLQIAYDRRALVYTQDPATLTGYINQMRRWYAGGWQNLKKHYQIFKRPANAFQLSFIYMEGFFFSFLLLVTPFISPRVFLIMILSSVSFSLVLGLYGALTRRRYDLLMYAPLCTVLLFVNSWIFIEQFVKEVFLKQKNLVWYHPERRVIVAASL